MRSIYKDLPNSVPLLCFGDGVTAFEKNGLITTVKLPASNSGLLHTLAMQPTLPTLTYSPTDVTAETWPAETWPVN